MAMLQCEIVTPTHVVYRGEVALVEVPSVGGYCGFLPGHEDFCCRMKNGKVTVYTDEAHQDKLEFATYMGFAQVSEGKVIVLAREGILIDDIKADKVRAEATEIQAKIDALTEEQKKEQEARIAKVQRDTLFTDLAWLNVQLSFVE